MSTRILLDCIKAGCFLLLIMFASHSVFSQEENLNLFHNWIEWADGKNMLVRDLNRQAFALLDERDKKIAALKTKERWLSRQKDIRDVLFKTVGAFPEKTPLNARILSSIKKDKYKIEKIVYESMPGFYVTGCLFLPDNIKGKTPSILYVNGHSPASFRLEAYQLMIINLVKKGFVVFAIDPLGQAERIQYYDPKTNASLLAEETTVEHTYAGTQCLISGGSLAKYFIWDGIRAIDYLLTRQEVDPSNIGITGQSGGGTQSCYIFAFDKRIKAAAPVDFVIGFRRLLESLGPQDAEQNLFHGLKNGLSHGDFLEVRAPSPVLISAGTRDFFSIQGARETFAEIRKAYRSFNKETNAQYQEDDIGHGYSVKIREGVIAFFQKHLNLPGDPKDEAVDILTAAELMVTPTGNVTSSFKDAETVHTINKKQTEQLMNRIQMSRNDEDIHLNKVQLKAKQISGFIVPNEEVKSVFRGRYKREGYSVEMYALHGEGNYVIPLLLFVPQNGNKFSSIVYLNPKGKSTDAEIGGKMEQLARQGYLVAAPDVIGTGETASGNESTLAMLSGRSIVGIQAGDVIRVANFLKKRDDIDPQKITGIAYDEMCPTLLHTAAFDKSLQSVSLIGSLVSYRCVVMNQFYDAGFCANAVPGALTAYDMVDLMASMAPRKIFLSELKDQMKKLAPRELVDEDILFARSVYSRKNVSQNLNISFSHDDIGSIVAWSYK